MIIQWHYSVVLFSYHSWRKVSWLFQRSFDLRIFYKVQFSHSVMSDSLRSHGLQHARLPCTNSWSLLKFMSIESAKPSNHLILCHPLQFSSVQSLSHVRLFATPWIAAHQASLSITNSRPPCPSPTPGVHSDSHPSNQWCHTTISSSVIPPSIS